MMFADKLVVAIKHNGRVLREQGDSVLVPFGSEYTVLIKNLNTVRAMVRVSIDGQDATKDVSLVVAPNSSMELERFLDAANMDRGHRFKFIERTKKIEDGPRGVGAEDGLIRAEFEFERQPAKVEYETIKRTYIDNTIWDSSPRIWPPQPPYRNPYEVWCSTATTTTEKTFRATADSALGGIADLQNVSYSSTAAASTDVGITVPGSISEQKFSTVSGFITDGQKHVMVLRLVGQVGEVKVEKPVTVKTKTECPTCGTKNKFGTKFCRECGRSLILV